MHHLSFPYSLLLLLSAEPKAVVKKKEKKKLTTPSLTLTLTLSPLLSTLPVSRLHQQNKRKKKRQKKRRRKRKKKGIQEIEESQREPNGLIIYPKQLTVIWGDDRRYWEWIQLPNEHHGRVPKLLDVCWLEIKGQFDMGRLTAGARYEAWFEVTMMDPVKGWSSSPVTLTLELPGGGTTERSQYLTSVAKNQTSLISMGNFTARGSGQGRFSMKETRQGNWKSGLVIKRVLVLPVGQHSVVACHHTCTHARPCNKQMCPLTIGGGGGGGGGGGAGGRGGTGIYQIIVQAGGILIVN